MLVLVIGCIYAGKRIFYYFTDGFSPSHIVSDFPFRPDWETRPLSHSERDEVKQAFNQPYHYLGKGCQSYVFLSEDQRYVIKFFKYQNYCLKPWLVYLPSLPAIVKYRIQKQEQKQQVIDRFFTSWKLAFEHLKDETGLMYIHLNKTSHLNQHLLIYDKLGYFHHLNLDQLEFCVQRRAEMLQVVLLRYKQEGELEKGKELIAKLLELQLSQYSRGFADTDPALLQNTGIIDGRLMQIDVGLLTYDEKLKEPTYYHQELFNRTYKLQKWLNRVYPELGIFLQEQLQTIIGPDFYEMKPIFRNLLQ
jgi:hypothetical protein